MQVVRGEYPSLWRSSSRRPPGGPTSRGWSGSVVRWPQKNQGIFLREQAVLEAAALPGSEGHLDATRDAPTSGRDYPGWGTTCGQGRPRRRIPSTGRPDDTRAPPGHLLPIHPRTACHGGPDSGRTRGFRFVAPPVRGSIRSILVEEHAQTANVRNLDSRSSSWRSCPGARGYLLARAS